MATVHPGWCLWRYVHKLPVRKPSVEGRNRGALPCRAKLLQSLGQGTGSDQEAAISGCAW
jgi:hypothetical protein